MTPDTAQILRTLVPNTNCHSEQVGKLKQELLNPNASAEAIVDEMTRAIYTANDPMNRFRGASTPTSTLFPAQIWEDVMTKRPDALSEKPETLGLVMKSLMRAKEYPTAARLYKEALKAFPTQPKLHRNPSLWVVALICYSRMIVSTDIHTHRKTEQLYNLIHACNQKPNGYETIVRDASWVYSIKSYQDGLRRHWIPNTPHISAHVLLALNRADRWWEGMQFIGRSRHSETIHMQGPILRTLVISRPNGWIRAFQFFQQKVRKVASPAMWMSLFHTSVPWSAMLGLLPHVPESVKSQDDRR
eukprot:PhF_6_TR18871/c0_g1_i3/m.27445